MATRKEKRRELEQKLSAQRSKTIQDFDALLERARAGDESAEDEYRKEAAKLAKKVNRQIDRFGDLTRTSAAFQRVEYFLSDERGREKFSEGVKDRSLSDLAEDVEQMIIFSTSTGYSTKAALEEEEQVERNESAIRAALGELPDEEIQYLMNEMFKSAAWEEFRKSHGRGTGLIEQAQEAFKRGRTIDDLNAAYEEFKTTKDRNFDITKAWYKFTGSVWTQHNNKRRKRRR